MYRTQIHSNAAIGSFFLPLDACGNCRLEHQHHTKRFIGVGRYDACWCYHVAHDVGRGSDSGTLSNWPSNVLLLVKRMRCSKPNAVMMMVMMMVVLSVVVVVVVLLLRRQQQLDVVFVML